MINHNQKKLDTSVRQSIWNTGLKEIYHPPNISLTLLPHYTIIYYHPHECDTPEIISRHFITANRETWEKEILRLNSLAEYYSAFVVTSYAKVVQKAVIELDQAQ